MDLGIAGRTAIVCASSRGLGRACAEALLKEGVEVVINGRDPVRLEEALRELRESTGGQVRAVVADVTTKEGRAALLAACPTPDILVNNNAGPDPRDFLTNDEERWLGALEANMVAPMMLVRAVLPSMIEKRFGRIVNITSAMVTTPRPHMTMSSGARAGLTAAMKGLSFEVAKHNITINNLCPSASTPPASTRWPMRSSSAPASPMRRRGGGRWRASRPKGSAIPGSSAPPAPSCAARTPASCPA